jgi:hypothetical protein
VETDYSPSQFNWANVRPQEQERNPLSGQVCTIRIHNGSGAFSYHGQMYRPDKSGIVRDVPVEYVNQVEGATYWSNGKPQTVRFDVIGRDSELSPSETTK